ncbi:MAG: hypothetical protein ACXWLM_06595, partial [Myxococcales bacterium]
VVELRPEGGATCMLKGAFLLPVGKIDLVPPDAEERHSAVVNIHFVLVGANQPSPSVVTIGAPIYSKAEVGKPAPGHFAFDLLTMFTPPEQTETYFIYVFSRDVMAGPFPVAFVGPDML